MPYQDAVLYAIKQERKRQDELWGADRDLTPWQWLAILNEEHLEVIKEVMEGWAQSHADMDRETLERLTTELTQVAAVAVAWKEAIINSYEK